jgi:hypothetical protein
MRVLFIWLLMIAGPAHSFENVIEVDFTNCAQASCFNVFSERIQISEELEVLFWGDVLETFGSGYPSFYGMVSIVNRAQDPIRLDIEVELQGARGESLGVREIDTEVIPYAEMKSQYDIYRPLNAIDLEGEAYLRAKYVKLRVREN